MELGQNDSFMDGTTGLNFGDDFFEDSGDLDRIFDDDEEDTCSQPISMSKNDGVFKETKGGEDEGRSSEPETNKHSNSLEVIGETDNVRLGKNKNKKRRRSSSASIESDRGGMPPAWHSEVTDKPHREAMIREM